MLHFLFSFWLMSAWIAPLFYLLNHTVNRLFVSQNKIASYSAAFFRIVSLSTISQISAFGIAQLRGYPSAPFSAYAFILLMVDTLGVALMFLLLGEKHIYAYGFPVLFLLVSLFFSRANPFLAFWDFYVVLLDSLYSIPGVGLFAEGVVFLLAITMLYHIASVFINACTLFASKISGAGSARNN